MAIRSPSDHGGRRRATAAVVVLALTGLGLIGWAVATQQPAPPSPPPATATPASPPPTPPTPKPPATEPTAGGQPPPTELIDQFMAPSAPVGVHIPAIDVSASIVRLGRQPDRTMEVPQGADHVGWYTGAPAPGSLGPAVLAGHVTWDGAPAVLFRLGEVRPGDRISVDRTDGTTAVFQVDRVEQFPKAEFRTEAVYGPIDHAGLRLITCGGTYLEQQGRHLDNIVVFASLVPSG